MKHGQRPLVEVWPGAVARAPEVDISGFLSTFALNSARFRLKLV